MSATFPRFFHYPETVEEVERICDEKKISKADWLREAVDQKLDAESGAD